VVLTSSIKQITGVLLVAPRFLAAGKGGQSVNSVKRGRKQTHTLFPLVDKPHNINRIAPPR